MKTNADTERAPTVPLERYVAAMDAAEMLWTVVANASNGDWTKQSAEWQEAATRWRDAYLAELRRYCALVPDPVRSAAGTADAPARTGLPWTLDCGCSADSNDNRSWCPKHLPGYLEGQEWLKRKAAAASAQFGVQGTPDAPAPTPPADAQEPPTCLPFSLTDERVQRLQIFLDAAVKERNELRDKTAALAQERDTLKHVVAEQGLLLPSEVDGLLRTVDRLTAERDRTAGFIKQLNACRNRMANAFNLFAAAMSDADRARAAEDFWSADADFCNCYASDRAALSAKEAE